MQPFPHHSDATQNLIEISQLALEIFKFNFKSVEDDGGPLVYYKLTLWAFGSDELVTNYKQLSNQSYMIIWIMDV